MTRSCLRISAVAAIIVALFVAPSVGSAHERSSSRSTWVVEHDRIHVTLTVAAHDLASGMLGLDAVRASPSAFADALTSELDAHTPAGACSPDRSTFHPLAATIGQLSWEWDVRCSEPIVTLSIASHLLSREAPHHLHVIRVRTGATVVDRILSGAQRSTSVIVSQPDASSLGSAMRIGVEHLLGGWDHLMFLLTLVIASTGLRALAIAVTGFTVGHSATLALGALGWVHPPTLWIEALIGCSIVVVAVERVLFRSRTTDRSRMRAVLAAAFGLVHGLGFAGALIERSLPPQQLVTALVGFNVGIELAQLAVAAIAWTLLSLMRKHSASIAGLGVDLASAVACCAGVYWTITRLA